MLISLNWIKKYVDIDLSSDELVKLIGSRLVEVEAVHDETHRYDKIYAVRVVSAEPIPDTHLSLCKIDDGGVAEDVERDENGHVQVMCGAPNVHAGMLACWIAPGAVVPTTFYDEEPFVIGARKMLKKYDSFGMLAGADELGFSDEHKTIAELDPETAKPGDRLADLFELDDIILDIENKSLTHRPDTFGIIGFAREVAGILGQPFHTPAFMRDTTIEIEDDLASLDIEIADPTLCPRYTALVLNQNAPITHDYLTYQDTLLCRSGMRPIDPIVDATNYLMLLTGQPLHAFDYDKFVAVGQTDQPKILVRAARAGETLELLDGKTIELNADDIVITSNDVPVALAGAMGGANTEIDANTKRVILESATFSLYNLRKTQMAHGIFSEAITRFTKGQPAGQTLQVAAEFTNMLSANFEVLAIADCYDERAVDPASVQVGLSQINELLGANFSAEEVVRTLTNVEFRVEISRQMSDSLTIVEDGAQAIELHEANDEVIFTCYAPYWRTDIHIPEDIIEEVSRLNGFDNIAPVLPLHATATPNAMLALKQSIREMLSAAGANEALTYSFVHGDLLEKAGQATENSYRIVNSISPDLQYIRQSIVPSLLDRAYVNLRANYRHFALFEMNQVYSRADGVDEQGVPQNRHNLGFALTNSESAENYYETKLYLEQLLKTLGVEYQIAEYVDDADGIDTYYEPKRSAAVMVGEQLIGRLGEIKGAVARSFKLPLGTAAFELSLDVLMGLPRNSHACGYQSCQYPFVSRDLTLEVKDGVKYAEIAQKIRDALAAKDLLFTLEPTSIYKAEASKVKSLSFHLRFASQNHTLAKDEIQGIMDSLEKIK